MFVILEIKPCRSLPHLQAPSQVFLYGFLAVQQLLRHEGPSFQCTGRWSGPSFIEAALPLAPWRAPSTSGVSALPSQWSSCDQFLLALKTRCSGEGSSSVGLDPQEGSMTWGLRTSSPVEEPLGCNYSLSGAAHPHMGSRFHVSVAHLPPHVAPVFGCRVPVL